MSSSVDNEQEATEGRRNLFRNSLTVGKQKEGDNGDLRAPHSSVFLVVVRRVVGIILFVVVLGTLVLSKLSFLAMAHHFNDTKSSLDHQPHENREVRKAANFWRVLIALIVPNLFSFVRCVWCGLISRTRRNYPWPAKSAIVAGFVTSVVESIALCIFAFILAARIPNTALTITLMSGVFSGTIVNQIRRSHNFMRRRSEGHVQVAAEYEQFRVPRNYRSRRFDVEDEYEQTGMRTMDRENSQSQTRTKSCWRVLRAKVQAFWKNKRYRTIATWIALILQVGSIAALVMVLLIFEKQFDSNHRGVLVSIPIALVLLSIVWCSAVQEYLNTPQTIPADGRPMASARWKNGILTGLWRIMSLPTVAIIMASINYVNLNIELKYLGEGLKRLSDNLSEDTYFLINIFCTWGAYIASWLACTVRMGTIGFVLPLLLATPVAVVTTIGLCVKHQLTDLVTCGDDIHDSFYAYGIVPMLLGLLWISQIICCLFYVWRTQLIPLMKEEDLFIQSYYNCPFTEQSLMLNRKTEFDDEKVIDPQEVARKSRVFVCTTMYREQLHEQRQLLESIHGIAKEQAREKIRSFESHIFFDGGAKGCHTTEFANQLFSLLHDALRINLSDGKKWETPYGLQIRWELPGDMPFYVHLKDPHKVKKKKRWSQVMYMSYVLDFRCPRSEDDDDNTFILTTDADIVFDRDAVEIVLDLLCRDQLVGGVCGRVHPLGSGPVVWYQKFDYAIGHWFQKVAEHVLGSVMCCPGCFSVFRGRALRDVLPQYATKADKANDFLTKDMGEDRWLCTLMVEAGWRLEYAASAHSSTFCPDTFDEFYKQRRRWTPSTMANLMELCSNAKKVISNNDAVSIVFIIYQAAMIFSTIISPGTVILVMSAGISYAFNSSKHYDSGGTYIAFLVIFLFMAFLYGVVCIWCRQDTQLKTSKVLTFIFAIIMAAVAVGVVVQIVSGLEGPEVPTPSHVNSSSPTQTSKGISLEHVAISTWYLAALALLFIMAALLHPTEFFCLFHALWYLLCLPSGYLFLIIYSICNLNDRSWGTRETVKQNTEGQSMWSVVRSFIDKLRDACGCCDCCHPPIPSKPSTPEARDFRSVEVQTIPSDGDGEESDRQISVLSAQRTRGEERPPTAGISIRTFLQTIGLTDSVYADKFEAAGYTDTSFFIKMQEKDIRSLGVEKTGLVMRVMRAIDDLPDTSVPRRVPDNVSDWLLSLGLLHYREQFARAGYEGKSDIANLVSINRNVLQHEIGVTKPGHLRKLEMAVKMIKHPSDREVAIIKAKAAIDDLPKQKLDDNENGKLEFDFWQELKTQVLEPDSEEYEEVEILKQKLKELRNETVLVFAVTNIIWIVLITMLGVHANLSVFHTNALGLAFLAVYGLIFLIQFLTLICHRLITLIHTLSHRVRFGSSVMPIGFERGQDDVDDLSDCEEAQIYFPRERPHHQHQDKRVRQSLQRLLSSSSSKRRTRSCNFTDEERPLVTSSRSRRHIYGEEEALGDHEERQTVQ